MKLHIPKIKFDNLTKISLGHYSKLNTESYGQDLATKVAEKLMQTKTNNGLYHSHRDYCGMGLFYFENQFLLMEVHDGYTPIYGNKIIEQELVASFETKEEFISWLSNESDQSMAFYGKYFDNQTITKNRLLWFLDENHTSSWNMYCHFLRENNL